MAFYRCGGGDTLNFAEGEITLDATNPVTVNIGFKPRVLEVRQTNDNDAFYIVCLYDEKMYLDHQLFATGATQGFTKVPITSANRIGAITDTGFVFNRSQSASYMKLHYIAIG